MRKAHREYAASCRRRDGLSFGYWLAYAWRIARDRRRMNETAAIMRRIADIIDDHLSRRIVLAPAIGKGMNNEPDRLGFHLSNHADHRASRDGRRALCRHEGAR